MSDFEKILSKIPKKDTKTGDKNYIKTKFYFTVNIGSKVGKEISKVKEECRERGLKILTDREIFCLLRPEFEKDIKTIEDRIRKIENALSS